MAKVTHIHFKKRAAAVAVATCFSFAPWLAEAAGLGKITVLSGFGQPLRAEVEVNASRAELAGMSARLASPEAFKQAGVEFAGGLTDLRFNVEKRGSGAVVKVTTYRPVVDPFMDILIELTWPSGSVVREYTFLLDPPEVAARNAAARSVVAAPEARVVETTRGVAAAPAPAARSDVASRPAGGEARKAEAPGTHLVQPGETLRKVAGETRHDGVSLEQMMVGLFRANPKAFIGENMNRMRAGAILNVPDKAAVAAVSPTEAREIFVAQTGEWTRYRQGVASAVAAAPAKDAGTAQESAGKVTARVEEKVAPADQARDQVKVSPAEVPAKGAPGGKSPSAAEEELIAKDQALKEAQERLAMLEKNVGDLQKLVDLKAQKLAELQAQSAAPKEAVPAVPAAPAKAPEPPPVAEPAKPAEPPKVDAAAKPAEEAKPVEAPKPAEPPKPVEPPKPAPAPAPAAADEGLFSDPLVLAGGGGIVALLAAYLFMRRRREEPDTEPLTTTAPSPSSLGPNSVFRMTGGQSVDTGNMPIQTAEFSQTGPGTIDTDEVDPVAEADVYMAYGRDAQAEEILVEAQRKDPHRLAIQAKLLEIYANRKSLGQFDTLASDLYAQTGGVGPEWEKAAALGAALDPDNPLYRLGREQAGQAAAAEAGTPGRATVVMPGTLGAMAAAGATAATSETTAESEAALDFDLGEPVAGEAVDAAGADIASLEFAPSAATPDIAPAVPAETDFATTFIGGGEAGGNLLEFELGEAPAGTETVVNPQFLNEALNGEMGTETLVAPLIIEGLEAGPGDTGAAFPAMSGEPALADDMAGMSLEYAAPEGFEISLEEAASGQGALPVPEFDMTSINLDLGAEPATPAVFEPVVDEGEAGTKFALAQAYEEMGDRDQARELLEEVIAEGSGDVVVRAKEMLERLRG